MPILPWETTVTCPYNPSHQITKDKLIKHLVKCKRSYPDADVKVCSFNASHHVPTKDLKEHEKNCPDAQRFMSYQLQYKVRKFPQPVSSNRVIISPASDEEDWEKEATVKESYNPYKMTASKQVLRKIEGATESERREFRDKEKVRLYELEKKSAGLNINKEKENRKGILLQRARNSLVTLRVQDGVDGNENVGENPSHSLPGKSRGRGRIKLHASAKVPDEPVGLIRSQPLPGKSRGRGRLVWGTGL